MIDHVKHRLQIDNRNFHSINWTSIGRVQASHIIYCIARTRKISFRWLPVGHNWYKCNLGTDVCPCFGAKDETFEHLLLCKHEDLEEIQKAAYLTIQKTYDKEKIPL